MVSAVLLAFALTAAAGFSTCVGGMVVFSKKLVYLANPKSLSIALGVSCGVMLFISFVEIFVESTEHFKKSGSSSPQDNETEGKCSSTCEGLAWLYTTLAFFLGIVIIYVIDMLVDKIHPNHDHDLTVDQLEEFRRSVSGEMGACTPHDAEFKGLQSNEVVMNSKRNEEQSKRSLMRTGVLTAIAIGVHNFPEGIATYVGALNDTKLGISLAIGIAIHNIPEGIAVAAPVYFATASRSRAFLWTVCSALAEPLGAFVAYAILGGEMSDTMTGLLFGIVAGMMICICVKEMIPTAFEYDPQGKHVTIAIFVGMGIMATSLLLFAFAGV